LHCHEAVGLVRCTEMEPTEAEKLKARRAQRLLVVLMVFMISVPAIIFILRSFR
jgi:hypothetical protein